MTPENTTGSRYLHAMWHNMSSLIGMMSSFIKIFIGIFPHDFLPNLIPTSSRTTFRKIFFFFFTLNFLKHQFRPLWERLVYLSCYCRLPRWSAVSVQRCVSGSASAESALSSSRTLPSWKTEGCGTRHSPRPSCTSPGRLAVDDIKSFVRKRLVNDFSLKVNRSRDAPWPSGLLPTAPSRLRYRSWCRFLRPPFYLQHNSTILKNPSTASTMYLYTLHTSHDGLESFYFL